MRTKTLDLENTGLEDDVSSFGFVLYFFLSYKLCELHEKWLLLQSLYSKPWLLSTGSSAFLCMFNNH